MSGDLTGLYLYILYENNTPTTCLGNATMLWNSAPTNVGNAKPLYPAKID